MAHELAHVIQQGSGGAASDVSAARPGLKTNAGSILARTPSPQRQPSYQVTWLARQAIDELDDRRSRKVLLRTIQSAANLSELPAYAAILRAAPHKTYGDHFVFLIAELEQSWGSKPTITILQRFADAGVDIAKLNYSLDPLAAVARFKSLVQRYQAALSSGRVREADRQRVGQAIADAEIALRGIEGPARKPGTRVEQMGGVALAAGALWTTAGILAADDVTVIGVADDVAIPFVIIAAATLSAIALFTGGRKPEILDYGPAKAKVDAALAAIAAAVNVAVNVPRPGGSPRRDRRQAPRSTSFRSRASRKRRSRRDASAGTKCTCRAAASRRRWPNPTVATRCTCRSACQSTSSTIRKLAALAATASIYRKSGAMLKSISARARAGRLIRCRSRRPGNRSVRWCFRRTPNSGTLMATATQHRSVKRPHHRPSMTNSCRTGQPAATIAARTGRGSIWRTRRPGHSTASGSCSAGRRSMAFLGECPWRTGTCGRAMAKWRSRAAKRQSLPEAAGAHPQNNADSHDYFSTLSFMDGH